MASDTFTVVIYVQATRLLYKKAQITVWNNIIQKGDSLNTDHTQ